MPDPAIDFEPPVIAQGRVVRCDGGGGPLGHPNVFLHIGADGQVVCPYCSRRFVLADNAKPADH
jgi:uncharacterized Zn-finger protein